MLILEKGEYAKKHQQSGRKYWCFCGGIGLPVIFVTIIYPKSNKRKPLYRSYERVTE